MNGTPPAVAGSYAREETVKPAVFEWDAASGDVAVVKRDRHLTELEYNLGQRIRQGGLL